MFRLRKVSVVILAQSHNPSIISPDWVKRSLSIDEEEQDFVHTPPFSLFDSASFLLTVDADRWQLVPKILDDEHISLCGQVAGEYFRALPHIPYKSLGLNYIWGCSPNLRRGHLPQISLKINEISPDEILRVKNARYGGTIEVGFKKYIMRLTMNYRDEKTLVFSYNFSHNIRNWSTRKRVDTTSKLLSLKAHSQEMTRAISEGKGKEWNHD